MCCIPVTRATSELIHIFDMEVLQRSDIISLQRKSFTENHDIYMIKQKKEKNNAKAASYPFFKIRWWKKESTESRYYSYESRLHCYQTGMKERPHLRYWILLGAIVSKIRCSLLLYFFNAELCLNVLLCVLSLFLRACTRNSGSFDCLKEENIEICWVPQSFQ